MPKLLATVALLTGVFGFFGAWHFGWFVTGIALGAGHAHDAPMGTLDKLAVIPCWLDGTHSFCRARAQVVRPSTGPETRTHVERFASILRFESAIEKLQWNHGSDAEAARLMSMIQILSLMHAGKSDAPARKQIERIVIAAWQDHPYLVTASVCAWCGDRSHAIDQQLVEHTPEADWVERVAAGHSKRFQLLASKGRLAPERVSALAALFGELSAAGGSREASFIANVLIESRREATLLAWVTKGLNGSWALRDVADLSTVPFSVIVQAWQHGVSMGYEDHRLTSHLLAHGHRPALRWVLWQLDGSVPYLDRQRMEPIREAASRHIAFLVPDGDDLARYYSDHWREIGWDRASGTWRRVH